jgi:hypothetical protein
MNDHVFEVRGLCVIVITNTRHSMVSIALSRIARTAAWAIGGVPYRYNHRTLGINFKDIPLKCLGA